MKLNYDKLNNSNSNNLNNNLNNNNNNYQKSKSLKNISINNNNNNNISNFTISDTSDLSEEIIIFIKKMNELQKSIVNKKPNVNVLKKDFEKLKLELKEKANYYLNKKTNPNYERKSLNENIKLKKKSMIMKLLFNNWAKN